jgi:MFS transporter, DHA1 family, multidrug resistance protein
MKTARKLAETEIQIGAGTVSGKSMQADAAPAGEPIGFREFVAMIAAIMAMVALAIDSMLPALPAIGRALGVAQENHRQFVLTAFLLGFGLSQLAVGVLSDRFGRRHLMLGSLLAFALFSLIAAFAPDFEVLLAARFFQGAAAAGGRVLVTSIVRDIYAGRRMAKVMSLAQILFLATPVMAPSVGQAILWVASWRWIFLFIGSVGTLVLGWVALRLPETLPAQRRLPLSGAQLSESLRTVTTERQSIGYCLAGTFMGGGLFGFLNSVQPIFSHVFHRPELLAPVFGLMSVGMGLGSFVNSRLVERVGMRRMGHAALIGFVAFSGLHATLAIVSPESLARFLLLQTSMMICFVVAGGNFGAMAMENMGRVAGAASSLQGFFSTSFSALFGAAIGQSFAGTVVPLYGGCFILGSLALLVVLVTERGKLFVPHAEADVSGNTTRQFGEP